MILSDMVYLKRTAVTQVSPGLPDESFNKKPNSAKKRSEKIQTDFLFQGQK